MNEWQFGLEIMAVVTSTKLLVYTTVYALYADLGYPESEMRDHLLVYNLGM